MPDFYRLVPSSDPQNGTTEIVLEKGDDGVPTKVVSTTGIPIKLNADDRKKVEAIGFSLETVSKDQVEKAETASDAGSDVAGAAPMFGDGVFSTKNDDK